MVAIKGFINHLKSVYCRDLDIDRKLIKRYSQRLVELYK